MAGDGVEHHSSGRLVVGTGWCGLEKTRNVVDPLERLVTWFLRFQNVSLFSSRNLLQREVSRPQENLLKPKMRELLRN